MSNKLLALMDVLVGFAVLATGTVLLMIGGLLIGLVLGAGALISRIRGVEPNKSQSEHSKTHKRRMPEKSTG